MKDCCFLLQRSLCLRNVVIKQSEGIHGQNMQILDPCLRDAWLVTNVLGFCGCDEGEAGDDKGSPTGETRSKKHKHVKKHPNNTTLENAGQNNGS